MTLGQALLSTPSSSLTPAQPSEGGILLSGHSGARVVLLQRDGRHIVRKSAAHRGQNERLARQAEKQIAFADAGIVTPTILEVGYSDDLFFFDMTYIPAISVAAQCLQGHVSAGRQVADWLSSWIERLRSSVTTVIARATFEAKIESILSACRTNAVLEPLFPMIRLAATALNMRSWPQIPASDAHGDLTLENILVGADGRLHLIDFDAPDMSSYWLDLAKIYQDLIGYWCIRHVVINQPGSAAHHNAVAALRDMQTMIEQALGTIPSELATALPQLVGLHLFRTLPYCRERRTASFVLDRITSLMTSGDDVRFFDTL